MTSNIVQLGITIHALRLDNKKITPALFQQFEPGSLLNDIKWNGVYVDSNEDPYSNSIRIVGRHFYKIPPDELSNIPFIYFIDNELRTSTVNHFNITSKRFLDSLRSEMSHIENLCEVQSLMLNNFEKGLSFLAQTQLLCEDIFAFYQFSPEYSSLVVAPVVFNSIHKNLMSEYEDEANTYKSLLDTTDEKEKRFNVLKNGIQESKLDLLIQRWFSLNSDLLKDELTLANNYHKRCDGYLKELKQKIIDSPKLYIGV